MGDYEVLRQLGSGAAGSVYLARREGEQRTWALKLLGVTLSATARERFEREAALLSQLEHPGLARCLEAGLDTSRNQPFLVLEYVHGTPLEQFASRPLSPADAARLVADLADAVGYAHGRGVIHRDIKPENVVVREADGRPVLVDFGLARQLDAPSALTGDGDMIGTPNYMAPEQVEGDRSLTDARTDVYAMGALLYRLLTGRPPFAEASLVDLCEAIQRGGPVPPRRLNPDVPGWLERVCLQALAVSPSERFETAYALARALRGPQDFVPRRRVSRAWTALAALGVLALPLGWLVAGWLGPAPSDVGAASPTSPTPSASPAAPSPSASPTSPAPSASPAAPSPGTSPASPSPGTSPSTTPPLSDVPLPPPPLVPPAEPTTDEERLLAALDAQPDLAAPYVELARHRLGRGDTAGAERALQQARGTQGGDAALAELRDEHEREVSAQRELAQQLRALQGRFEMRAAVELARTALEERPGSSLLHSLAAELYAAFGANHLVLAHLRQAFLHDPRLATHPDLGQLGELARGAEDDATTGPESPVWESWVPALGGRWTLEADGWLAARGEGLGPFSLATVVAPQPLERPRWEAEVEVDLGAAQNAYGGLLVGAEEPSQAVLVYVFADKDTMARAEGVERTRAYLKERGHDPSYLRLANLVHGEWRHLDTRRVEFDPAQPIRLTAQADGHVLRVSIHGELVGEWELERDLVGRVGVLKYYDVPVRFRGFELRPQD